MENKHIIAIGGFGLLILLMVLLVFQSVQAPKMKEDLTGINFNKSNSVTPPPQITELSASDLKVGTDSAEVVAGDTVTIHYVGAFTNGKIFDNSYQKNQPFTFKVGGGQIIGGIEQGVIGMKVGGKRRLFIPANLAYGAAGQGSAIPPNTSLIFEIELMSIMPKEIPTPSAGPSVDPSLTPSVTPLAPAP